MTTGPLNYKFEHTLNIFNYKTEVCNKSKINNSENRITFLNHSTCAKLTLKFYLKTLIFDRFS